MSSVGGSLLTPVSAVRVTRSRWRTGWLLAVAVVIVAVLGYLPYQVYSSTTDLLVNVFILITQARRGYYDPRIQDQVDKNLMPPPPHDFILYGGCTLIVDRDSGEVRYAIGNRVDSDQRLNEAREMAQRGPV